MTIPFAGVKMVIEEGSTMKSLLHLIIDMIKTMLIKEVSALKIKIFTHPFKRI